jgi:protein AATF/BFR2
MALEIRILSLMMVLMRQLLTMSLFRTFICIVKACTLLIVFARKSKLRKPQAISLGPQYTGSRVSRNAIADDDEDDPFVREYGSNTDEEEEEEEEEDDDDDGYGIFDEEDEDALGPNYTSSDAEEDSQSDRSEEKEPEIKHNGYALSADGIDKTELRKLMADDQKRIAANLSQSAKVDCEKGRAVKKQRTTFDSLLNVRIKLQKALVAVNSIPTTEDQDQVSNDDEAIIAAETAAVNLWNNLNALRMSLHAIRTGTKRKYSEFTSSSQFEAMWDDVKANETESLPQRNSTLDFWSSKCRTTTAVVQTRKLNTTPIQQNLSDVLASQLSDIQRLIDRTRIPRSCAPLQAAKRQQSATNLDADDLPIYDDADFYSTLLQSLISQRSNDTTSSLSALNINFPMEPWQAAREAKTKKAVDTKASKGRKLKYTVHEKLQNFMAPEDRTSWGERQCDELFGSLFGRRVGLGELDEDDVDGDEAGEVEDAGLEALRLFAGE